MARVAGYLTQFEMRVVDRGRMSYGVDGVGRASVGADRMEMTFTLLVENGDAVSGLGQGRVVLHDGSCDADRLGGLERERDEYRRRAERLEAELKKTREKLSNTMAKNALPLIGNAPSPRVDVEPVTVYWGDYFDGRCAGCRGPRRLKSSHICEACFTRLTVQQISYIANEVERVRSLQKKPAPKAPPEPATPVDARFAALDFDDDKGGA